VLKLSPDGGDVFPQVLKLSFEVSECKTLHPGCDHEVVTRISLGTVFFFCILSLAMLNTPSSSGLRQRYIHRGSWWLKFPLWALCIVLAFLLPPSAASGYFEAGAYTRPLFGSTEAHSFG
jgi:hypothetical protein